VNFFAPDLGRNL